MLNIQVWQIKGVEFKTESGLLLDIEGGEKIKRKKYLKHVIYLIVEDLSIHKMRETKTEKLVVETKETFFWSEYWHGIQQRQRLSRQIKNGLTMLIIYRMGKYFQYAHTRVGVLVFVES